MLSDEERISSFVMRRWSERMEMVVLREVKTDGRKSGSMVGPWRG